MQMVKSEYFTFEDDLIEMITEYVDDMWRYADIEQVQGIWTKN